MSSIHCNYCGGPATTGRKKESMCEDCAHEWDWTHGETTDRYKVSTIKAGTKCDYCEAKPATHNYYGEQICRDCVAENVAENAQDPSMFYESVRYHPQRGA